MSRERAEWLGQLAVVCERILAGGHADGDPTYAAFLADVRDLLARLDEERQALAEGEAA